MARRGVSAAVGTLLFAVIASAFLALMLRMFYDLSALAGELSIAAREKEREGVPSVKLNYTALRSVYAEVTPLVHGGYAAQGDLYSVKCLNASDPGARQALSGVVFPVAASGCVALVRVRVEKGSLGSIGNLTVAVSGSPAFVEVYEGGDGAWRLAAAYVLNGSAALASYRNFSLIYAYNPNASASFNLTLSNLQNFSADVSSVTEVFVTNTGPALLDVRAVWLLNETYEQRLEERRVLAPGESHVFRFATAVTLNGSYEVRVVTSLTTYVYRFKVGG
ncbi:MAG: hypothetical protein QXM71_08790 [Thermofilum sp.]